MLTRVVVVAFVSSIVLTGFADAQATRPAVPPPVSPAPAAAPVSTPAQPPQPLVTTPPAATRPTNRSAEETLRQMLQPQGSAARPLTPAPADAPPAVDETSGVNAVAPNAPSQHVMREGTLLLDRLGRLTRGDDGFEFTLAADGRAMSDPPLKLLPNRKLMQLEDRVQSSYRDLQIRVSGEVMEYRGRNYLLLQRWAAVADVAQPLP
jgi:hypothetical protein